LEQLAKPLLIQAIKQQDIGMQVHMMMLDEYGWRLISTAALRIQIQPRSTLQCLSTPIAPPAC
jgi:hypothetical protein